MHTFVATRALAPTLAPLATLELFAMAQLAAVHLPGDDLNPEVARALRRHGLAPWLAGLPREELVLNLAALDDDLRRRMVRRVAAFLPLAGDAGAVALELAPGLALVETRGRDLPSASVERARAQEQLLRSLDALAAPAERAGVPLWLVHPDGGDPAALGTDPPELIRVVDTLQIPWLKVVLDWGRLARLTPGDPEAPRRWGELLGSRIGGLKLGTARYRPPAGEVDECLEAFQAWHALPWALEVRGLELASVLDARDALMRRRRPVAGPAR